MYRLAFALAALVACTGVSEPDGDAPIPPADGKSDGGAFHVTGGKRWYLVGDDLTPGNDRLELAVDGPADTGVIDLWLDNQFVERARPVNGKVSFSVDLTDAAIGDHLALLAADNARVAFAAVDFKRSHPLYVTVTNDWDDPDNDDPMLERQERLHARHPDLLLTHFVGPYTFTDPSVSAARRAELVDWVTKLARDEGDEIGLHVHPWCSFVRAAGVTCRTSPSFAHTSDTTGYTVILSSYTQTELEKLFDKATELFLANGLPQPTSFRAGGWTAERNVLEALAATGHVADSSGCNWARLEEWRGHADAVLYPWNQEHWISVDETSQPYFPSKADILEPGTGSDRIDLLEVPDNGALVDYVSSTEMIDMFRQNWPGYADEAALASTVNYTIGYHPPNFSEAYFQRMDQTLTELDRHLASADAGPVVYARVSDLTKVYKP